MSKRNRYKEGCTGVLFGSNLSYNKSQNKKNLSHPKSPKKQKGVFRNRSRKARLYTSQAASFTIEAALVLPLFLLLMFSVLYLFEVGRLQMQIRDALYDTAVLQARTAYLTQEDMDDSTLSSVLSSGVLSSVSSLSLQSDIDSSLSYLIVGGTAGILCTEDTGNSSDTVTALQAECTVKIPVSVFGSLRFTIAESVSVRNWNGYETSDTEDSDMVYVTKNGTVYHEDRNCTYLNLSVTAVTAAELPELRNSSGGKYHACSYCADSETSGGIYYITAYGTSYHTSLSCSGLKRTVYLVSRDETDLPACSKCGGSSGT